jgi:predicted nucleic acid-binding Zn finger protein
LNTVDLQLKRLVSTLGTWNVISWLQAFCFQMQLVPLRRVKRLTAERSGRSAFQVQGKSSKAEEYLCFPSHYCSCRAFQWDVISRGDQLICKHQLAARLAEAMGLHASSVVTDLLLAQLLEAYMRGTGGEGGHGGVVQVEFSLPVA